MWHKFDDPSSNQFVGICNLLNMCDVSIIPCGEVFDVWAFTAGNDRYKLKRFQTKYNAEVYIEGLLALLNRNG